MRDIERWITETKVSAELAVNPLGWEFDDARVDIRERWALEVICNALLERGAIVPVSKRSEIDSSCVFRHSSFCRKCRALAHPFLPTAGSLALWTPLLMQLHEAHTTFPSIFISRIISVLLDDLGSNTNVNIIELDSKSLPQDPIYREYLARWANWAAQTWTCESEHGVDLRKEVVLQLAPIFVPGHNSGQEAKMYGRFALFPSILIFLG